MTTLTLEEAPTGLAELVHGLSPGQIVTITENERPIAQLIPLSLEKHTPSLPVNPNWPGYPHPGSLAGLLVVPDDFKESLEEMREYIEMKLLLDRHSSLLIVYSTVMA